MMNIEQLRELETIIYDIYYNGENPEKFRDFTGIENYMKELYPSDTDELFGPFISEHFDAVSFIQSDIVNAEVKNFSDLYNKVMYYANLPNGQTFKQIADEYNSVIEQNPNPSSEPENL